MSVNMGRALALAGGLLSSAWPSYSAVLVQPRMSGRPTVLPGLPAAAVLIPNMPASLTAVPVVSLAAPLSAIPLAAPDIRPEGQGFAVKVAELGEAAAIIAASPGMKADAQPSDSRAAGVALENLLTGQSASPAPPATEPELSFAAKASLQLGLTADDVGSERGLKFGAMTGQDFLDMISAARERLAGTDPAQAPSPRAREAARTVRDQVLRVVRALIKPDQPLKPQISRILAVWQVFNQEMEAAAGKGDLEAIEAEARLFADQVERSV